MEGFVRRIWKNMGVDKVVVIRKGIFIVRFNKMEKKDRILSIMLFSLITNH